MESERFELLQRAVAAQTSRRGLAGLFAGLALGGAVALTDRRDAEVKNRRRRRKKAKKKNGSAPFTPSPFAPQCVTLGSACSSPSACCNWHAAGALCTDGPNGSPVFVCPPGDTCESVANQKGGKQCATGTQCCRMHEATCTDTCDCCGSMLCSAGKCVPCKNVGGVCTSRSDCCGSLLCSDGMCATCIAGDGAAGPCLRHSDCCGALLCDPEGYCMNCLNVGAPCADNSECCPGIDCQSGVCQGL